MQKQDVVKQILGTENMGTEPGNGKFCVSLVPTLSCQYFTSGHKATNTTDYSISVDQGCALIAQYHPRLSK